MRIEARWFIEGENLQTAEEVLFDERMKSFLEDVSRDGFYKLEPRIISHKMPEGVPSYVSLGCEVDNWCQHATFFMRALVPKLESLGINGLELWVNNQPFWVWVRDLDQEFIILHRTLLTASSDLKATRRLIPNKAVERIRRHIALIAECSGNVIKSRRY